MYETGAIKALQPTNGTFDGAPHIQTPSRAEYSLGGLFVLGRAGGGFKVDGGFWATIALLFIGAIFGGLIKAFVHLYLVFDEGRGIAVALKADIDAILALIKRRNFTEAVDAIIRRLEDPSYVPEQEDIFAIPIAQDYFSVFNSVAPKIGMLGDSSRRVVRFNTMLKSLIDEIQGLRQLNDNILKGLIPFDLHDRRKFRPILLAVTQSMRAFFDTMQAEGVSAANELNTRANMAFRQWVWSRFR